MNMHYLKEMCRLCLKGNDASRTSLIKFVDVSSPTEDGVTYFHKISSSLTRIADVIELEDFLLCERCSEFINKVYHFNIRCLTNISTYSSYKKFLKGQLNEKRSTQLSVKIEKIENNTPINIHNDIGDYVKIKSKSLNQKNIFIKLEKEEVEETAKKEKEVIMFDESHELDAQNVEHISQLSVKIDNLENDTLIDKHIGDFVKVKSASLSPENIFIKLEQEEEVENEKEVLLLNSSYELDSPICSEFVRIENEQDADESDIKAIHNSNIIKDIFITESEKDRLEDVNTISVESVKNNTSNNNLSVLFQDGPDCNHFEGSTGQYQKTFRCNVCSKIFKHKCTLIVHTRTHTGERPFKCNICKMEFAHDATLRRHMRTHTGEKPFKCNLCELKFSQGSNLKRHMRTHTGERPFKCNLCEMKFARGTSLREHLLLHTGEQPFKCKLCEMKYNNRSSFGRHLRTHTDVQAVQPS